MMWGYGSSWGGMFLMLLGMALWIALLVVLAWAIMRWLNGKTSTFTTTPHTPLTSQSALEILQHRYARGEIDEATYEQMREQLENTGARSYRYDNPPVAGVR